MVYDINLLPKNKNNESGGYVFLMALVGILSASILLVFFFLLPLQNRSNLMNQIKEKEEKLDSYAECDLEYTTVTKQLEKLNHLNTNLERLKANKKDIRPLLEAIGASMPEEIVLNDVSYEDGLLTLAGVSDTYNKIAQFMVNLRKLDEVQQVTFTTATKQESGISEENNYDFNVYVRYNYADIIAEIQAEEANTTQEGE